MLGRGCLIFGTVLFIVETMLEQCRKALKTKIIVVKYRYCLNAQKSIPFLKRIDYTRGVKKTEVK